MDRGKSDDLAIRFGPEDSDTDSGSAVVSEVSFPAGSDRVRGYLAAPSRTSPGKYPPAVIVLHEAFGPTPWTRDITRRMARSGYVAFLPDLYSQVRHPDPEDLADCAKSMLALRDGDMVRYVENAAEYLDSVYPGIRVGVLGFCMGARYALLAGSGSGALDAVISCWPGQLLRASADAEVTAERPVPVVDVVRNLQCPCLVVGGAEDSDPSPSDLFVLQERLEGAPQPTRVVLYQGAGHAFLNDSRPLRYRRTQSAMLWSEILDFFGTTLGSLRREEATEGAGK